MRFHIDFLHIGFQQTASLLTLVHFDTGGPRVPRSYTAGEPGDGPTTLDSTRQPRHDPARWAPLGDPGRITRQER